MLFALLFLAVIVFSITFLVKHFKKIKEKTEENKTKGAELNPTGKKIDKNTK